ncbi:MAG: hypothetical protein PHV07_05965 [Oscillospiraceae bacterium]|nr:hypothetical protein [Oscillospiraceae bacterium]
MNIVKNKVIITVSVCFILVLSIIIIAINYNKTAEKISRSGAIVSQTALYIVKDSNGKIAIYKYGEQNPVQVLEDPYIDNLPEIDQQRLSEGIDVFTEDELSTLIEDLSS